MPSWEDLLGTPYGKATPEQIKRAQEHAYALLKPRETPNRSWASPIADVLHALQGNSMLNRSTLGGYDQRQEESGHLRDALMQMRGGQTQPLTTGSLPPPQTAMNAPSPGPQPEAPVSPEVTTVPGQTPQMTPDDGTKLPLPTPSPTITGTGNPTEQPKNTGFKLDSYIKRLFEVESGNNPAARKGSYRGLAQFSPDLEKKYGINDNNWQDPTVQINAAARHAIESSQAFKTKFGHDPSEGEMYLMHQQGVNGGTALLGSSPNAPAYKTLAEASGASEDVAKQRVASNIPTGSALSKKPVEAITNQEFSRLWVNKFDKGETSPYQAMRLGGPKEEDTVPVGPQGQQVAQNTTVPPALPNPTSRINPDTLQKLLGGAGHAVTDDQKEMIQKMMMEGAIPKDRNTAKGPEQYDPNNPNTRTNPGVVGPSTLHLSNGMQVPVVHTQLPDGRFVSQYLIPGQGLTDLEGVNKWARGETSKDQSSTKSTDKYEEEYSKYQDLGSSAQTQIRNINLMKNVLEDDNMYTGTGDQRVLDMKKVLVALGKDPDDRAASNEVFKKLMAGGVLEGLGQFKGLGQIRVAEIEQLQKSLADSNMTKPAIRSVLTLNQMAHRYYVDIANEASDYAAKHDNKLDRGWDKHLRNWKDQNPFMTDDQIKDWKKEFAGKPPKIETKTAPKTDDEWEDLGNGIKRKKTK